MLIVTQTNQDQDNFEKFVQGPVRVFTNTSADTSLTTVTQLLAMTASDLKLDAIQEVKIPDPEEWGANAIGHLFCDSQALGCYVHLVIYRMPS